jgi:hypothetical protein
MIGLAQSDSQRDPITLTDKPLELSLVVKATFDILYDREVASFKDANLYHQVIEFARKWDMPVILKTLSMQILVHTNSEGLDNCINQVFSLATDLGEPKLLTAIMRSKVGKAWGEPMNNPEEGISRLFNERAFPSVHRYLTIKLNDGLRVHLVLNWEDGLIRNSPRYLPRSYGLCFELLRFLIWRLKVTYLNIC